MLYKIIKYSLSNNNIMYYIIIIIHINKIYKYIYVFVKYFYNTNIRKFVEDNLFVLIYKIVDINFINCLEKKVLLMYLLIFILYFVLIKSLFRILMKTFINNLFQN